MNRKQLEDCAWDRTPPEERRDHVEHQVLPKYRAVQPGQPRQRVSERRQRVLKLTGNNREVRVFDPSGSTPGTVNPWVPLWSLYNDELTQRCEQGREPKLRAPYTRVRRDYKSSIDGDTKHAHASKLKSPARLDREIAEALARGNKRR